MDSLDRLKEIEYTDIGHERAREIQNAYPSFFLKVPVKITDIAKKLDLNIEKRYNLRQRAQLEIFRNSRKESTVIYIQSELSPNEARYAIAHEIGHAILIRNFPHSIQTWATIHREMFAHAFAEELLVPLNIRIENAEKFRSIDDPVDLLKFASHMGLSPYAFLTIAEKESLWIKNLKKIWLRILHSKNKFTGRDAKLRIDSVHYDRDYFFVPKNQSIQSFIGNDQWLASFPIGGTAHLKTMITIKTRQEYNIKPKYIHKDFPSEISAIRIRPNEKNFSSYIIMLVDLSKAFNE